MRCLCNLATSSTKEHAVSFATVPHEVPTTVPHEVPTTVPHEVPTKAIGSISHKTNDLTDKAGQNFAEQTNFFLSDHTREITDRWHCIDLHSSLMQPVLMGTLVIVMITS